MAELTIEQQRALALARVRRQRAQAAAEPTFEGGAAGAAALGAADTASFGFGDELGARLGAISEGLASYIPGQPEGRSYDEILAKMRDQDKRAEAANPGSYLGGQIAGAFALPGAAATSVPKAIAHGAAQGTVYGVGAADGDANDRLIGGATGAMMGGATGGVVGAAANALASRAASRIIPSTDEIKAIAQAGYKMAGDAGVVVKPEGVKRLGVELKEGLAEQGYLPKLQPRVAAVIEEADRLGAENLTFKSLDNLRRVAGNVAGSADKDEARIGVQLVRKIENYMENLPADDVLAGNASQAAAGFREGQENWARFKRSELVDTQAQKAARRAASTGTGGNADNAMRQNVRQILDNPRKSRGMTDEELAAAERVVMGSKLENGLRQVGRLSPTTGGLSTMMTTAGTMMNPILGVPALVGAGAKIAADRSTARNVQALSEVIRSGGKTSRDLVKAARRGEGPRGLLDAIAKSDARTGGMIPLLSVLGPLLADKVRG